MLLRKRIDNYFEKYPTQRKVVYSLLTYGLRIKGIKEISIFYKTLLTKGLTLWLFVICALIPITEIILILPGKD